MQSLQHCVSPRQAEATGLRLVVRAAQELRPCFMRGRWDFMTLGVRVDQSNPHGVYR